MTRPLRPLESDPTESVSAMINAAVNDAPVQHCFHGALLIHGCCSCDIDRDEKLTKVECPQCGGDGYISDGGCEGGGCEYCRPFPKYHEWRCNGWCDYCKPDDKPHATVERPQSEGDEP